jgi:hypothetical protein
VLQREGLGYRSSQSSWVHREHDIHLQYNTNWLKQNTSSKHEINIARYRPHTGIIRVRVGRQPMIARVSVIDGSLDDRLCRFVVLEGEVLLEMPDEVLSDDGSILESGLGCLCELLGHGPQLLSSDGMHRVDVVKQELEAGKHF